MIYDFPSQDAPIRQGDIFLGIPKVEIEFAAGLATCSPTEDMETIPWEQIVESSDAAPTTALLPVLPVPAIVASQDCDARRAVDITLCEIKEFAQIEKQYDEMSNLKKKVRFLTRQACVNLKWFYLPPDKKVKFEKPMAVYFLSTINVPRKDLEQLISLRKGRLNEIASEHFRERIAHFYRRYAYNEWYPLNNEEMAIYSEDHNLEPSDWYDHQKKS